MADLNTDLQASHRSQQQPGGRSQVSSRHLPRGSPIARVAAAPAQGAQQVLGVPGRLQLSMAHRDVRQKVGVGLGEQSACAASDGGAEVRAHVQGWPSGMLPCAKKLTTSAWRHWLEWQYACFSTPPSALLLAPPAVSRQGTLSPTQRVSRQRMARQTAPHTPQLDKCVPACALSPPDTRAMPLQTCARHPAPTTAC